MSAAVNLKEIRLIAPLFQKFHRACDCGMFYPCGYYMLIPAPVVYSGSYDRGIIAFRASRGKKHLFFTAS